MMSNRKLSLTTFILQVITVVLLFDFVEDKVKVIIICATITAIILTINHILSKKNVDFKGSQERVSKIRDDSRSKRIRRIQ